MRSAALQADRLRDAVVFIGLYALAVVYYFGGIVPIASGLTFLIWIGPLVVTYAAAYWLVGCDKARRASRPWSTLSRLLTAHGLAVGLLASADVLLQPGLTRLIPLTVIGIGGALSLAVSALLDVPAWRRQLTLAVVSTLLALAAVEAFLRAVHDPLEVPGAGSFVVPSEKYRQLFIPDPRLHYRLRPNAHVVFEHPDVDSSRMDVRINSVGMRDAEYSIAKPPRTVRIVLVGDSLVFGDGVEFLETMGQRLEERLRALAVDGTRYQVMNWGVVGYSLRQELEFLRQAGAARYQPDLLLVGLGSTDFGQSLNPLTYEGHTGLLVPTDLQRRLFITSAGGFPRLHRLVRYGMRRLMPPVLAALGPPHGASSQEAVSTRADLAAFRAYADDVRIPIGFILFPDEDLVRAGPPRNREGSPLHALLRRLLADTGAAWLDLLPLIQRTTSERGRRLYVAWDSLHFNAEGHEVIAQELAGWLRAHWSRELQLPTPSS